MKQAWKEKALFISGLLVTTLTVGLLFYFFWSTLISMEAKTYGKELTLRLQKLVVGIDREFTKGMDRDLYQALHQKPLSRLQLQTNPKILALQEGLTQNVHNGEEAMALFTDCPETDKSICYEQFYSPNRSKIKVVRQGYDPKSRPWYIATRAHTDWVVLHFMLRSRSRESGYPTSWGIGIARRYFGGPAEEHAFWKSREDREHFAQDLQDEKGIWFLLTFAGETPEGENPFLKMLYPGEKHPFQNFDTSFRTIRFPQDLLQGRKEPVLQCASINNWRGWWYEANVSCHFNGEPIQYTFSKRYDHPVIFILLIGMALAVLYVSFLFFRFVYRQNRTLEESKRQKRIEELVFNLKAFPRIEDHDLLPLSKKAYEAFVKEKYGSFPQMAAERGLDLNHLYRVHRKFKEEEYIVYKYDTIREMIGAYNPEECLSTIGKLLWKNPK